MNPPITLRPATPQDEEFFYQLFRSVRAPQFAAVPLTPNQLEGLLQHQYLARTGSYNAQFPVSENSVVLSGETPAGQLWVFRSDEEHLVVDIALLPEYQGSGIGSMLMQQLIEQAKSAGVPLKCSVATNNPGSLRFHQRLGFQIYHEDPGYYYMERPVAG